MLFTTRKAWADRSFKDLILLRIKQLLFVRANMLISYFLFDNDGLITKASHRATMFCGQKAKLIVSLQSNFDMYLIIIINIMKRFSLSFLIQIVWYHRPRCQEIWRQGSPMDATGHAPFLTGSDATFVHFYDRENYTGHWRCAQQQRDKRYEYAICYLFVCCFTSCSRIFRSYRVKVISFLKTHFLKLTEFLDEWVKMK